MDHPHHSLVAMYAVHIVRGNQLIWTKPESMTRAGAEGYADSFNRSLRAKTHGERARVTRQNVIVALPEGINRP